MGRARDIRLAYVLLAPALILLDLKAGPNVIVARVDPTVRVKHQDKMRLSMHPERVHFFDNKTELAI